MHLHVHTYLPWDKTVCRNNYLTYFPTLNPPPYSPPPAGGLTVTKKYYNMKKRTHIFFYHNEVKVLVTY